MIHPRPSVISLAGCSSVWTVSRRTLYRNWPRLGKSAMGAGRLFSNYATAFASRTPLRSPLKMLVTPFGSSWIQRCTRPPRIPSARAKVRLRFRSYRAIGLPSPFPRPSLVWTNYSTKSESCRPSLPKKKWQYWGHITSPNTKPAPMCCSSETRIIGSTTAAANNCRISSRSSWIFSKTGTPRFSACFVENLISSIPWMPNTSTRSYPRILQWNTMKPCHSTLSRCGSIRSQALLYRITKKNGFVPRIFNVRLLDRQGDGVEFSLITNSGNKYQERMATMIQQDLAGIGIKLNIVTLDFPSLIERITRSFNYEACLLGLVNNDLDPDSQMNIWLS